MATDTTEIVVASDGHIWAAPYGATLPDDIATAVDTVDPDFLELGYADENGVTLGRAREINDVPLWQSRYPGRRIVASEDLTIAAALRQWNTSTFTFVFGGGTVEEDAGVSTYTPPEAGEIIESSLVVEWQDGTRDYRMVIPKGMVTETSDVQLVRTDAANLGFTFGITPDGTQDAFYLITNDANFVDTAS